MEEADLLKERLQFITDKRRIQEEIAQKRRQIEEEKLKLQYIKKKALRDQWLMDGLSQQSEEEQEALRLQNQDEQQQSQELQSNILSMEQQIQDLETQELNMSANEEAVLKRLKEVERTAEDIIKELKETILGAPDHPSSPLSSPSTPKSDPPAVAAPVCPAEDEPTRATIAVEISVEQDRRTGRCTVLSTTPVSAAALQDIGLKVYEDSHRSVYALPDGLRRQEGLGWQENPALLESPTLQEGLAPQEGPVLQDGLALPAGPAQMSLSQVEELLRQASEQTVPAGVRYHRPVFSVPYGSRPSTPATKNTGSHSKTTRPGFLHPDWDSRVHSGDQDVRLPSTGSHSPGTSSPSPSPGCPSPGPTGPSPGTSSMLPGTGDLSSGTGSPSPSVSGPLLSTGSLDLVALVSVTARSEGVPSLTPAPLTTPASSRSNTDTSGDSKTSGDCNRQSPFHPRMDSPLNLVQVLPLGIESQPVTMVFMGYENAEDQDQDVQAELVIVGDSEGEEGEEGEDSETEDGLSYHPQGCRSQVFRPTVNPVPALVLDYTETHKPTFTHKPGKNRDYLQGQGAQQTADTATTNLNMIRSSSRTSSLHEVCNNRVQL